MDNQNTQSNDDKFIEQLKNYIQQQMRSGLQPDEINAQLHQAGWADELIKRAFQSVQNQVMPNAVTAAHFTPPAQNSPAPQASVQQPIQPSGPIVKRGRIKTGWLLFKESLKVLKSDKMLTRYVFMNAVFSILLVIIYAIALGVGGKHFSTSTTVNGTTNFNLTPLGYILTFVYYILAYFIFNLYMAGLAANVLDMFSGNKKDYGYYMKKARSKAGPLFVFSLIEATIGLLLRAIAERSRLLGRIVIAIIGAAWSVSRLFVVPIIVSSDENPIEAIKDSTKLLISTWGENIVGRVSMGGAVFLLTFAIFIPIAVIVLAISGGIGGSAGIFVGGFIFLVCLLIYSLIIATASNILNTTLFYYAKFRQIPPVFDADLLNSVFIHKKERKSKANDQ